MSIEKYLDEHDNDLLWAGRKDGTSLGGDLINILEAWMDKRIKEIKPAFGEEETDFFGEVYHPVIFALCMAASHIITQWDNAVTRTEECDHIMKLLTELVVRTALPKTSDIFKEFAPLRN